MTVQITPDPVTGNAREAECFKVEFAKDWEVNIEIDIYEKNAQGERLFEIAKTLPNQQQREAAMSKYFPVRRPYTTRGSMIDANGNVVEQGGVLSEREFLESLTIAELKAITGKSDSDSALGMIKEFVRLKIQEISSRGQN